MLEAFRTAHKLGISQLVAATGLPKATVHRLVRALTELGYLEQDPQTAQYRLGPGLISLARLSVERLGWRTPALEAMKRLKDEFDESTYLALRDGFTVSFIDEVISSRPVRVASSIGLSAPLHATAAGKAIMARLPAEELEEVLERIDFTTFTSKTVRDAAALKAELETVRKLGYAVNDQEWMEGACYVASAFCDRTGRPLGAISLGAPANRLPPELWDKVGRRVAAEAARISSLVM